MANLINIDAETGANMIGDDSQPTLTLDNSSTGAGLAVTTASATGPALTVTKSAIGNISVGVLRVVGNSIASGAVLEFSNKAFVSITSVILTSVAHTDYAIRVQVGLETRWIPCFKDAAIIGAAAF